MPQGLAAALRALRQGGVVAYPTEGVWGLGCAPRNRAACLRLLKLKRRRVDKGLILIAADFAQLRPYLAPLTNQELAPALKTWPGPHTWIIPASRRAPRWITGRHAGIAVRVTAHPVAAALCRAHGGALVSTSANRAGRPAARSAFETRLRLGREIDALVPGATGGLSKPTPIRDLRTGKQVRA